MGYTDLDFIDGFAGIASGLMKNDQRKAFSDCYEGAPKILEQTMAEFSTIDVLDLMDFKKDSEEIEQSWSFFHNIL